MRLGRQPREELSPTGGNENPRRKHVLIIDSRSRILHYSNISARRKYSLGIQGVIPNM